MLSFVAGIVPLMRPFLSSLWATLTANEGSNRARNLVHVRRVAPARRWILALLGEKQLPFVRVVRADRAPAKAIVITDASAWGMGGVILIDGKPAEHFSCPIPHQFVKHTGAEPGNPKHMSLWESLALLLAARIWLPRFPLGSVIRVKADNISALYLLAKCKAANPQLAIVARELALDQARGTYEFTIFQRINTNMNRLADPPSRQSDPSPPEFPPVLKRTKRVPIEVDERFWLLPRFGAR